MNLQDLITSTEKISPIYSQLSFEPLLKIWKEAIESEPNSGRSHILQKMYDRISSNPELRGDNLSKDVVLKFEDDFEVILGSLFPLSTEAPDKLYTVCLPFDIDPLYSSKAFSEHFLDDEGKMTLPGELDLQRLTITRISQAYRIILSRYFNKEIKNSAPVVFKFIDNNGLLKYFQFDVDSRFMDVELKEDTCPQIDTDIVCGQVPSVNDIENWMKKLPLDKFVFKGFAVITLRDLTMTQGISDLRNELMLHQDFSDPEFLAQIQLTVKSILQCPKINVGIAAFQNFEGRQMLSERRLANSFLISKLCDGHCAEEYQEVINLLDHVKTPKFIKNIQQFTESYPVLRKLNKTDINSVILYPLFYDESPVGVLEISSENEDVLNETMIHLLDQVTPVIALALHRSAEVLVNNVRNIIKTNYTAIQPVVEWKFNEAAVDILLERENGNNPQIPDISFKNVYPLYAALDIRQSSTERNKSIHIDLKEQLNLAGKLVQEAAELIDLPILDKYLSQINKMRSGIKHILIPEDERSISSFLVDELNPLFKHLGNSYSSLKELIKSYFDNLSSKSGMIHSRKKAFDDSLQIINDTVSDYLEKEQKEVQKIFPHYFEKYRTDGIEYNIYIGQSLVKERQFNEVYLKNLRFWQLRTLIELAKITNDLKKEMPYKLDTTQLILVHNEPLSIKFRIDERKFDVEGSYNIRYEIMKKRIDKALIKGTGERLTQPDKVAIVYSRPEDMDEYIEYISYFQEKGSIDDDVENLEIDTLQGVQGLKALRISLKSKSEIERKSSKREEKEEGKSIIYREGI
ncbi:GAF domain-containing protein [Marinigracilibium pacificum]|uniref:GAF domain-containing protein n=1 Tax=Marinigracilibium pacificum TaxID=2729599 RepID=A0A848IV66_9BACT|nr:GAF domain-containing protein [Marinigracilibium pacificum]NMM48227.1 GAF domain-containing protein [Marinigracilibium pacificum]